MVMKIPLSFKENEKHIYEYIRKHLNYSVYIKELVLKDMKENGEEKAPVKKNRKNNIEIDV